MFSSSLSSRSPYPVRAAPCSAAAIAPKRGTLSAARPRVAIRAPSSTASITLDADRKPSLAVRYMSDEPSSAASSSFTSLPSSRASLLRPARTAAPMSSCTACLTPSTRSKSDSSRMTPSGPGCAASRSRYPASLPSMLSPATPLPFMPPIRVSMTPKAPRTSTGAALPRAAS